MARPPKLIPWGSATTLAELLLEEPIYRELNFGMDDVKRFQEWLCLDGGKIAIDGIMGPATMAAAAAYGYVGTEYAAQPMRGAILFFGGFGERSVVAAAEVHELQHPREVGGPNRGPWCRLYGGGIDGHPWCADFVTFVLRQACLAQERPMPIKGSASCDELARQAREAGRLTDTPQVGDIMLIYSAVAGLRRARDYNHCGIVVEARPDHIVTIEGNTNTDGGREGYEVERRWRSLDRKMYIRTEA